MDVMTDDLSERADTGHAQRSPTLTFVGAAGTVTGSKTLLETAGSRVLVDCGLFQGHKELRLRNWEPFPTPPPTIDSVVLTHAHLDHCGYLPRLVREGFEGPILCTEGTARLAGIVLRDSAHLQEEEAEYANRKGYSKHDPALPLYTRADAEAAIAQVKVVPFDAPRVVAPGITVGWRRAGHILGAAWLDVRLERSGRSVAFSGDLGQSSHPLLTPPEPIPGADVVVCESTYGDEDHPEGDPEAQIGEVIDRAVSRGGVVVIPAFAVDRTEVVLWHLNRLTSRGVLPRVPVYLDSPMAVRALDVYADEARKGSPEIRRECRGELFPEITLIETPTTEESKMLNDRKGPFIVVSASGMATGGRVVHHLANRIGDQRNVVLLVGYQAPGTRGAALRDGARKIKLLGQYHSVRAQIESVGLSSHADRSDLLDWLGSAEPRPGIIYVNHGEQSSSQMLVEAIEDRFGIPAVAPRPGELVRVDARSGGAR
jgi:metallo-beta-lactamase family protein